MWHCIIRISLLCCVSWPKLGRDKRAVCKGECVMKARLTFVAKSIQYSVWCEQSADEEKQRWSDTAICRPPFFICHHGIKGFVISTKSFVKIGITKIFCYNNKMFSSINKTFGCCSEIFGCSNKKIVCCPYFRCRNKTIFFRDIYPLTSPLAEGNLRCYAALSV